MPDPDLTPQRALPVARILWIALLAGELMFMITVGVILATRPAPSSAVSGPLTMAAFAALLAIPVAYIVRSQTYKRHWRADRITPSGYVTGNLLLWAICETCAMVSLVVVLLTANLVAGVPAVIALAVHVINFPTGAPMFPDPSA